MDVLVVDKLTYASNVDIIPKIPILKKDICDVTEEDLGEYDFLVNFADESHVDNSIKDGKLFVKTNIEGTYNLLELKKKSKLQKFVQISTDEVYGDLDLLDIDPSFEQNFLYPSSYYSKQEKSDDMLVYSCEYVWITLCYNYYCNNFGINQHSEKFIPTIMRSIKEDKPIPVYGDGKQIREWIWVEDNVKEILKLMLYKEGTYNIGSGDTLQNIDIVAHIAFLLGKAPKYEFVEDRKGHDRRYTLDTDFEKPKITKTLFQYLKEQL